MSGWLELGSLLNRIKVLPGLKEVIPKLIAISDEEYKLALLEETAANVRRLVGMHFASGIRFLADMQRAQDEDNQLRLLHDARRALAAASHVDAPLQAARAERLVGLCYELLGERENAIRAYLAAFQKADAHYSKLLDLYETDARTMAADVLLGLSIVGQPIMYWRWTRRYLRRRRSEEHAERVFSFLSEVREYVFQRQLSEIYVSLHDIKPLPLYQWADGT